MAWEEEVDVRNRKKPEKETKTEEREEGETLQGSEGFEAALRVEWSWARE